MSAVGKIKASGHAPQRSDMAIKLYIKSSARDILCNYMYIHLGKGIKGRVVDVFSVTDVRSVKKKYVKTQR